MTPQRLLQTGIIPAFAELHGRGIADTPAARRIVLAIALQESGLQHRRQVLAGGEENGPAASFWQFEKGGGCAGVLRHHAVARHMTTLCDLYNVQATPGGLWEAMRYNDVIAAAAARLLLYTLPMALPSTESQGWEQYLSAWRPGRPHPERWADNWMLAEIAVETAK